MLKRATFYELIQFIMYGIGDETEHTIDYEERVENSFDRIFEILEREFPNLSRENIVLHDAISEFAIAHDEAYFEMGFVMGLNMYKSIGKRFSNMESEELFSEGGDGE